MNDLTQRLAIAATAFLVVTGCTTESSSEGCNSSASGFTGEGKSELGEGQFDYEDGTGQPYVPELPSAIAVGGRFKLTYHTLLNEGGDITLRSSAPDILGESAEDTASVPFVARAFARRFIGKSPGIVAVLATRSAEANVVEDLVHVRVLAPSKIEFENAPGYLPSPASSDVIAALERGELELRSGVTQVAGARVLGELDGEHVALGGLLPRWESSDPSVLEVESNDDGAATLSPENAGTAVLTVSAGDVVRSVDVTVTEGIR